MKLKTQLLALALGVFAGTCAAQDRSWMPTSSDIEKQVGQYLEEGERARVYSQGIEAANAARSHYQSDTAKRGYEIGQQAKRRLDQVANAAIESRRGALMRFLGYSEEEPSGLYYLVTWEMPLELLRSYAREARWSGGLLVFRGVPEGKELTAHIIQDYAKLSEKGDTVGAPVTLDPRLFDMFDVKVAPAIVLVEDVEQVGCDASVPKSVRVGDEEVGFKGCGLVDSTKWWKVSGGVTTLWALDYMAGAGSQKAAERAEKMRSAVRKHKPEMAGTEEDGRTLKHYTGEWEQAITAKDLMQALEMRREQTSTSPHPAQ